MIKSSDLLCSKVRGGKNPLWHCRHKLHYHVEAWFTDPLFDDSLENTICGAGNTPENAMRDWRKQYKRAQERTLRAELERMIRISGGTVLNGNRRILAARQLLENN